VPIELDGLPVGIECSIGVAFFPDQGREVQELAKRAGIAMYQAKHENRPYAFFDGTSEDNDPAKLTLVGELRLAIDRRELELFRKPSAAGAVQGQAGPLAD
jgi:predicted signal transduction protein with EAL and GGDEF domain